MNEEQFDDLLKEMRGEDVSAEELTGARQRVRERLTGSMFSLCPEFRAELSAYVDKRLSESRRLLLEDHLGRCADCRKALAEVEGRAKVVAVPVARRRTPAWTRWAVAAGVVLAMLYLGRHEVDRALAPAGPRATVVSVSGEAYDTTGTVLTSGTELFERDVIRTGAGARAVLALADGSRLEVNQRTKLSVNAAWSGQTVRLDYGDLLLEAAPQSRGRLRVMTRDSTASVKGTIFAVSSATAGSLVSVVEGEVEVVQSGTEEILTPGQQAASSSSLDAVGIEQAIAWSEDAEKYYGLLAELAVLEQELSELPGPAVRTEAQLAGYLPPNARVYVAIPNLDGTIRQALSLVDQRASANPTLDEWWSSEEGRELRAVLDRIQAITPFLGEEVLFVLSAAPGGTSDGIPLLLAEVQTGREEDLSQAIGLLAGDGEIRYEIVGGLLLISDTAEHLTIMSASLGGGASSPFAAEIAGRYQRGVSWLTAIDLAALRSDLEIDGDAEQVLGLSTMRYLFVEHGSSGGDEATLQFSDGRTGIASWLAAPGPAGSAEYVSSEAIAVVSASVRDPRQAFDEIVARLGEESELARELDEFESETGISVGSDIAASLGTDVTFALERPRIPVPGWIAAFETVNPGALDDTARRLVETYNHLMAEQQTGYSLAFTEETVNGRSWKSIRFNGAEEQDAVEAIAQTLTLHWTYDRGYLIASMDRALALQAIAIRDSGSPLIHTDRFQRRFPATSNLHHSGFFWFNTNGVVADLASVVQSPALERLLESRDPMLVVIDGEPERIHAASRTRLTSAFLDAMIVGGIGQTVVVDP